MAGLHEIAQLMKVLNPHIDTRAKQAIAPHKSDFGDVVNLDPLIIKIRGNGVQMRGDAMYWDAFWNGSAWALMCPPEQLSFGDRVTLIANEGEYTVIGRATGPGPQVGIVASVSGSVNTSTALGGDLSGSLPAPEVSTVLNGQTPATVSDMEALRGELRAVLPKPDDGSS
jgi:hypothetical protein